MLSRDELFASISRNSEDFCHSERKENFSFTNRPDFNRGSSCVPGHLNSPIYMTEVDMLIGSDEEHFSCLRHKKILEEMYKNPQYSIEQWSLKKITDITHDYMAYLKNFFNRYYQQSDQSKKFISIKECLKIWTIQYLNIHQAELSQLDKKNEASYKPFSEYCALILGKIEKQYYKLKGSFEEMKMVEDIKDNITYKEVPRGSFTTYQIGLSQIKIERDICLLSDYSSRTRILVPTTMVLAALDSMQCRFPLYFYWMVCDIMEKYPGINMLTRGQQLIGIFEDLRGRMKKNFFGFVGDWEALVIGHVIKNPDDIGCYKLYENQKESMDTILDEYRINHAVYQNLLPSNDSQIECMFMLEITGISKCFGYPILQAESLLNQLREYGTKLQYTINMTTLREIDGIAKREFIHNYFDKHHRLPQFKSIPKELETTLSISNFEKQLLKNHTLASYSEIIFDKNLDYDFTPDQTTLIKDSSSAPNLSAWGIQYDRCAFSVLYGKRPPKIGKLTSDLRTINAFLNATEDQVRTLINERERGIFDEEDHMSVQCGKERELKEESGRAFTKQTSNHRLIQTSMEHNVANGIFPYVPEQSMTDGEVKLSIKMMSQSRQLHNDKCEFICLDLKKFCIHEVSITNHYTSKFFDELFGLSGLYLNSHKSFVDCNIFTNNRLTPPDYDSTTNLPIPGPYFMNKYIGGFEGMHQKKWTFTAVYAIKLAIEKCNIKAQSMGQGDNQIIIIEHPPHCTAEQRTEVRNQFLSLLEKIFKDINLKLKEKETWYSKHLYEYGKSRVYKGACISQGTKKCTRVQPDINDGFCAIPSCVSTINTLTESISRSDFSPHPAFLLNCLMVSNFIIRKKIAKEPIDIMSLALTPNDFGGLPLSSLYSHMVRGHSDNVTLWLSIYKTLSLIPQFRPIFKKIQRLWITHPKTQAKTHVDRSRLYEDPYSLNIVQLPSADSIIKNKTLEFLMSNTIKNPMIKRLYSSSASLSKQMVLQYVDQMNPSYPQIGHELLVNSNAGLLQRLQQKFTSIKTIENIVKGNEQISLLELIISKNEELTRILNLRLRRQFNSVHSILDSNSCVVDIADHLREVSWGKKIKFVSKSFYPCQVTLKSVDKIYETERGNSILIQLSQETVKNKYSMFFSFGKFQPYIGSSTKEKLKKQSIDFGEKTSFTVALNNLRKLKGWFNYMGWTGHLKIVDELIEEKIASIPYIQDIGLILDDNPQILSGNIVHRFQSEMESSYALLNGLPSISSNFKQTTNLLRSMTKNGEDWTIFYQIIFISNIALLSSKMLRDETLDPFYYAILECQTCTQEINNIDLQDINFTLNTSLSQNSDLPFPTEIIPFNYSSSLNQQHIYVAMSYSLGLELADNIDKNFYHFHITNKFDSKSTIPMTSDISVNDLKMLDLEIILTTMVAHSIHCLRLATNFLILDCFMNDKSFTYLAELLMNAGLVKNTIKLLEMEILEHSTLTIASKLSFLISRHIKTFVNSNLRRLLQTYYLILFKETKLDQKTRYLKMLLLIMKNEGQIKRIPSNYPIGTIHSKVRNMFGIQVFTHLHINSVDIISEWRKIRGSFTRPSISILDEICEPRPKVTFPKTQLICNAIKQPFPISEVKKYWIQKVQETSDKHFDFPFLSFLSRSIGVLSSAASKYVEILAYLDLTRAMKNGKGSIMCLAEGAGGTIATLSQFFPYTKLLYNTLNTTDIDPKDDISMVFPPASYRKELDITDRFLDLELLNLGTTDILSDNFLLKLDLVIAKHSPWLITMDAESLKGTTNLEFVLKLLPRLLIKEPPIIIFKMFYLCDLNSMMEGFMSNYPRYKWAFYKPISSNPNGFEVFLVLIGPFAYPFTQNFDQLKYDGKAYTHLISTQDYDKGSLLFSYSSLNNYLKLSKKLGGYFMSISKDLPIILENRYTYLQKEEKICSLNCKFLYSNIFTHLNELHNHNKQGEILSLIREGGTNKCLYRSTLDFIFLSFSLHKCKTADEIQNLLIMLDCIVINEESFEQFRADKNAPLFTLKNGEGNFFSQWNDKKIFLQDFLLNGKCLCNRGPVVLYLKTPNMSDVNKNLPIRIYKDIQQKFPIPNIRKLIDNEFLR